jgi:malate dehydrogenase (oxaloacetate-decarboxylating)(NADP+)
MKQTLTPAESALRDSALEYHRAPTRGKISVTPTKPLSNQRDLSLAYSPGVAYACLAIWLAWSPTGRRFWAWGTSGRLPASR